MAMAIGSAGEYGRRGGGGGGVMPLVEINWCDVRVGLGGGGLYERGGAARAGARSGSGFEVS